MKQKKFTHKMQIGMTSVFRKNGGLRRGRDILLGSVLLLSLSAQLHSREIDFHRDVAPILRDYCAGCHNEADYDGDFSVETFRALMEGGETENKDIIVPGDAAASFLVRVLEKTAKPAMPPKKEPQLSSEEIALLKEWINAGAQGPDPEADKSLLATLNVPSIDPSGNGAEAITALAHSADGKMATARFRSVSISNADGSKLIRELTELPGKVNAVHFSPDGRQIVVASGVTGLKGVALIFEVETGKLIQEIGGESHRDILYDAEFSPDGKLLATAGYDRVIRLWSLEDGTLAREIEGHNGAVYDLAFSPNGKLLASASGDHTGKIWMVENGQRLDTLNQPQGEQFRISFTDDGKYIVAAGADNRIRLWQLLSVDRPRINPLIHARFGHEDTIVSFSLFAHKNGQRLATASADGSVKIWTLPGLEQLKMYGEQPDIVSALSFPTVGRMDGSIDVYDQADIEATSTSKSTDPTGLGQRPNRVESDAFAKETVQIAEIESSDVQTIQLPAEIKGKIAKKGDTDTYRFSAKKGERWILEVNAARNKSMLDSKVEVLTEEGESIEQVVLQAQRDSWFTFRGKDSNTSDDFRIHNWREMELNEYLYANGEVVKLWFYPRGPDSGFRVYPGFGKRYNYFNTTAFSQPLGGPCYIVKAFPPGSQPSPNGLPIYRIPYENDDDPERRLGSDSKLTFVAPGDGEYLARISDVRGFGGEKYQYQLNVRHPRPDFSIKIGGADAKVSPGSGKELSFTSTRMDGFRDEIEIRIENLPAGFTTTSPVVIEKNQERAWVALRAAPNAVAPTKEEWAKTKVTASAKIGGKVVTKNLPALKNELGPKAKVLVKITAPDGKEMAETEDGILELQVSPGETVEARVIALRDGFDGRIDFGKDESGRNLPHGVYVANTGLNGLMIPEKKTEQRLFIAAAKWVPETERIFHLQTTADSKQTSQPVRIRVVNKKGSVARR